MGNYISNHWIISILLTIFLGAIGSGLWETVFKPIIYKIGNAIFTLLSFGAKRARDNIYKKAARGHHELPSLLILFVVLVLPSALMLGAESRFYQKIYQEESYKSKLIETCKDNVGEEKIDCIKKNLKIKIGNLLHIFTLLTVLVLVFTFRMFLSLNKTNSAITYYQQCLKICRPIINETTFFKIEQNFSLIETQEQYFETIKILEELAEENSLKLPKSYLE